jgi:hypothetical protein
MNTTHCLESRDTRPITSKRAPAASAGQVQDLLREINIALHATRVIGRRKAESIELDQDAVPVTV